ENRIIRNMSALPRLAAACEACRSSALRKARAEEAVNLRRRQFLHLAAGVAALPVVPRIARAQTYPSRPVRIIVPFAPGGSGDYVARLIAEYLTRSLGQQIVVENRTGAGGMLGVEMAAKSPPDGHTFIHTDEKLKTPRANAAIIGLVSMEGLMKIAGDMAE